MADARATQTNHNLISSLSTTGSAPLQNSHLYKEILFRWYAKLLFYNENTTQIRRTNTPRTLVFTIINLRRNKISIALFRKRLWILKMFRGHQHIFNNWQRCVTAFFKVNNASRCVVQNESYCVYQRCKCRTNILCFANWNNVCILRGNPYNIHPKMYDWGVSVNLNHRCHEL